MEIVFYCYYLSPAVSADQPGQKNVQPSFTENSKSKSFDAFFVLRSRFIKTCLSYKDAAEKLLREEER